jgi:hypothetical protein
MKSGIIRKFELVIKDFKVVLNRIKPILYLTQHMIQNWSLKSSEILKYSHFLVGIVHLLVIGLYIPITMSHNKKR